MHKYNNIDKHLHQLTQTLAKFGRSFATTQKDDSHTNEEWVTAERYYALGGDSRVRLSHGVCPPCYKDLSESFVRH